MLNRRGLLAGILGAGFAPAFVGAKVLMPVKKILTPVEAAEQMLPSLVCREGSLINVVGSGLGFGALISIQGSARLYKVIKSDHGSYTVDPC